MRILLVEDEKSLSAAICQVLKREHLTVTLGLLHRDGAALLAVPCVPHGKTQKTT